MDPVRHRAPCFRQCAAATLHTDGHDGNADSEVQRGLHGDRPEPHDSEETLSRSTLRFGMNSIGWRAQQIRAWMEEREAA